MGKARRLPHGVQETSEPTVNSPGSEALTMAQVLSEAATDAHGGHLGECAADVAARWGRRLGLVRLIRVFCSQKQRGKNIRLC